MTKKKKPPLPGKGFGDSTQKLIAAIAKIESQMERKQWGKALQTLQALEQSYPNNPDVLICYINFYYEIGDIQRYQHAAERLLKVNPENPHVTLGLAGAYVTNVRPMLALRTFRRFLDRWPNDPWCAEVRKTVAELESNIETMFAAMNLTGEDAAEIATLHEEAQCALEQNRYLECRQLEEQILERRPNFLSAFNNISQTYWMEGNLEQAIATTHRVLDIDRDNYHALSNLTRYLCITGKLDEAKQRAEQLKNVQTDATDNWVKKAEAFSFLGDDKGVLDVFANAERAGDLKDSLVNPLLYHLAAVASLRQGQQKQARQYWQKALQLNPGLDIAKANLDDLDQPISKRHAPWAFRLSNWITQQALDDLLKQLQSGEETEAAQRYLQQHPEIATLIPLLFDRGDRQGREFALRLAKIAKTPELLEALRDFGLSDKGPDDMRQQAAQIAAEARLLPDGPVRLWIGGKWQEILLMNFQITEEPTGDHPEQVMEWLAEAIAALKQRNGDRAEQLLKQALEVEPDAPDLSYNLAAAYQLQGRKQEFQALMRQIHSSHPDYAFARIAVALQYLHQENPDKAEALLKPLLSQRHFHIQEFSFFCNAQVELCLVKGNLDAAKSWLAMWENADPENPGIERWRKAMSQPRL